MRDSQIARNAEPDVLDAPPRTVVQDDTGNLPALADARAVAEEEAAARAVGSDLLVALARVEHALKLQAAQLARRVADSVQRRICAWRQRYRGEQPTLADVARVDFACAADMRVNI